MADINVERKGASIWPWIIGLIVAALLIWLLAELLGDDDEVAEPVATEEVAPIAPMEAPVAATAGVIPPAVEEFTANCATGEANVSLDHEFTSNCINRLTAALDAVVTNPNMAGVDLQQALQDYRQKADQLVNSPTESTQHANMTREAFTSMADLVDDIQEARFPALGAQVDQLEAAAEAVQGNVMMTEQAPAIQAFFRQAGDVLRAMATTPPAA